jgi:hypothetical protein
MQASVANVRHITEALIREGFFHSELDAGVRVGEPLPVMDENGSQHSWFVPLEAGGKLAGFAQLLTSLIPLRFSSFQRRPRDYDSCPDVADWTDVRRIAKRAASIARSGEQLSEPVLTYDGNPSRLAWRVEAKTSAGTRRLLYVAGTTVYEAGGAQGLI